MRLIIVENHSIWMIQKGTMRQRRVAGDLLAKFNKFSELNLQTYEPFLVGIANLEGHWAVFH